MPLFLFTQVWISSHSTEKKKKLIQNPKKWDNLPFSNYKAWVFTFFLIEVNVHICTMEWKMQSTHLIVPVLQNIVVTLTIFTTLILAIVSKCIGWCIQSCSKKKPHNDMSSRWPSIKQYYGTLADAPFRKVKYEINIGWLKKNTGEAWRKKIENNFEKWLWKQQ